LSSGRRSTATRATLPNRKTRCGDTPLAHDRQVKLPCYAAAGLSEVWIADLVADLVGTYRVPAATVDTETRRLVRAQHAAPAAFPDVVLSVADIVG
jgi:hypothetical protein